MRLVAGLERPTSGDIVIDGLVVTDLPPRARNVAMVFQSYALYPHQTVEQNMGFALKLKKIDPKVVAEKVRSAADILELTPLLKRYPRQLSGGQRQRVAMGRAIVRDPRVFLFDEPLSNLDAQLRVQMRTEIKELHQRLKTTTIYVTHDQIEAMTMADKIVVMNGGRIEQIGAPLELFDRPANLFVAGFIGSPSMNRLKGTVKDGGRSVDVAGSIFPAPDHGLADGQQVVYGVRPEHFELSDDGVEVRVAVIEPTGSETLVYARTGEIDLVALFRDRHDFRSGDHIRIRPKPGHVHMFDAASGARL
jgi:multiple sugar transport system ATP-binding protein